MLVSLGHFYPDMLSEFIAFGLRGKAAYVTVVSVIAITALILVLGHLSSVITRSITRPLLHGVFFNPRKKIFHSGNDKFWNSDFKERVYENFYTIFGYSVSEENKPDSTPRLIRSYVLNHYSATREIRDRIVRARSLCANSVLPVILFALSSFKTGNHVSGTALLFLALSMLWKQHDLDNREWKEIYTAFADMQQHDTQR